MNLNVIATYTDSQMSDVSLRVPINRYLNNTIISHQSGSYYIDSQDRLYFKDWFDNVQGRLRLDDDEDFLFLQAQNYNMYKDSIIYSINIGSNTYVFTNGMIDEGSSIQLLSFDDIGLIIADGNLSIDEDNDKISISFNDILSEINIQSIIKKQQYNFSHNPTWSDYDQQNDVRIIKDQPSQIYITGMGYYNEYGELLATSKFSRPIKKSNKVDLIVLTKFNYI